MYYNMGNAYYKDNQIGKAILYYNKALRLDPGNDDIKHNLTVANTYVRDRIESVPEFFLKTWARDVMYWAGSDTW
ncbi:tetratricopeptide repeat protein, partial [Alistipes sp. OttesenSCG-928-L06]|nr:tetratricopeptide repeat protein [Alistipes sp. OttesenSCG-928-L06]